MYFPKMNVLNNLLHNVCAHQFSVDSSGYYLRAMVPRFQHFMKSRTAGFTFTPLNHTSACYSRYVPDGSGALSLHRGKKLSLTACHIQKLLVLQQKELSAVRWLFYYIHPQ